MKNIVILGSSGSIGRNAVEAAVNLGEGYHVLGLAVNSNIDILLEQIKLLHTEYATVYEEAAWQKFKPLCPAGTTLLPPGKEGLDMAASLEKADIVLNSVTGAVGFSPLLAALRSGKNVALANKEPMVMAGALFMQEAAKHGARILPVDSEPSAVFQSAAGIEPGHYDEELSRIFLTASGGPFYDGKQKLEDVKPEQALKHPRWKMGPKITIDSSTLMNKGLEMIEIMNMFGVPLSKIEVLIHPQSVIHSGVEFKDGAVIVQISWPDMRLPIQYALTWPERKPSLERPMDFFDLARMDFARPDFRRFRCLQLALDAGNKGNVFPSALSAANEIAVSLFLKGRILFTHIPVIVEKVLEQTKAAADFTLEAAVGTDRWARIKAEEAAKGLSI